MAEHLTNPILQTGRIVAYRVELPTPLYILGRYTAPCGGCDTIPDMDLVIQRLNHFAQLGNVLLEGLRTSGVMGRLGANSEQYGPDYIFAFLDTTLDECIANINERRAQAGKPPLGDHKHTLAKYRAVLSVRRRVEAEGRTVMTVPWRTAKDALLERLHGPR